MSTPVARFPDRCDHANPRANPAVTMHPIRVQRRVRTRGGARAYDGAPSLIANRSTTVHPRQHTRTDRDAPYHFAGRVDELALLSARLGSVITTRSAAGGIALITGVPGSGKSALCREFLNQHQSVDGVATLSAGVSDLDSATGLFLAMGREIGEKPAFKKIADVHTRTKGWRARVPAIAAIGVDRDHVRQTSGFADMLRESAAKGLWKNKAFAILFDELQNIEPEQAKTLRVLHEGAHECPIMVVGAGLQHTDGVLSSCGISRVSKGIALGALDPEATREALDGALDKLGIAPPGEIIDELAAASHDFPQHIHCYIAASRDVVKSPVGWRDPDVLSKVLRQGGMERADYYNKRLRAMRDGRGLTRMLPVIAKMGAVGVKSLDMQDAIDAVTDANMDGAAVVADAVQHGVLTLDDDERVSFGIPSFHAHMAAALSRRGHVVGRRDPPDRGVHGR